MLQLVPTLALLLQAAPSAALIDRISRLAASEPVEYGIDTRLKLAEALGTKYPDKAQRQLRDAQGSLAGVLDAHAQDLWRARIVQALVPFDFEEAERLAKSIRPDRKDDYLAHAYDALYAHRAKRERAELVHHAIAAGAFRLKCAATWLRELKLTAPGEALALFEEILHAFPNTPDGRDIEYLQERAKEVDMSDNDAVKAALKKSIIIAKNSPAGQKKEDGDEEAPDVSKLPPAEALELIATVKDPGARAGALIELSRREDLSRQQQARMASEALTFVGKMKVSEERLLGLSMLSRDFVRRQEYSSAALAAQMLSETYAKACDCASARCKLDDEKFDCIGLMNDFAEYLHELKIKPDSMGLQNISLEARLLILALPSSKP